MHNPDVVASLRMLFTYYKGLAEKAVAQVNEEDLQRALGEDGNSIVVLMRHIAGNARSRFTDFLSSDGEKPWRDREGEFTALRSSRDELLAEWNASWTCLFNALDGLTEADLGRLVYIRNEGHTVLEALHRQLAHYAYHVGQIVLLARSLAGPRWVSLSIPRGKSQDFNAEKFAQPAAPRHFTGQGDDGGERSPR